MQLNEVSFDAVTDLRITKGPKESEREARR